MLKFGARLRDIHDTNNATANFDGTCFFLLWPLMKRMTPLQFTLTTGTPDASVNLLDAGLYIQDDWKWRPNVMLSGGLRFETQNHISDHARFRTAGRDRLGHWPVKCDTKDRPASRVGNFL